MVEKRVNKFGQGPPPPPLFGQCLKDIELCEVFPLLACTPQSKKHISDFSLAVLLLVIEGEMDLQKSSTVYHRNTSNVRITTDLLTRNLLKTHQCQLSHSMVELCEL